MGIILKFGYHDLQSKIGASLYSAIACYILLHMNFRKGNCMLKPKVNLQKFHHISHDGRNYVYEEASSIKNAHDKLAVFR